MTAALRSLVETSELGASQVVTHTRSIYQTALNESSYLDGGDFTAIHPSDLRRLFDADHCAFFKTRIGTTVRDTPLRFRLSKRMTAAHDRDVDILKVAYRDLDRRVTHLEAPQRS